MNYFAGIINFDQTIVEQKDLLKMMNSVTVYNVKEYKVITDKSAGFVIYSHGRLQDGLSGYYKSMVDDIYVIADARIYNADKVAEKLGLDDEKMNVAELIYRSYMKWGEECLDHFVGDFAFSLWDGGNKTLFCARDHIGIRPIFYFYDKKHFLFASDLDSIIYTKNMKIKPNTKSFQNFVNGCTISDNDTFYENVFRIPPGHKLIIKNDHISVKRYWHPDKITLNETMTFEEASGKLRKLFIKAVKDRTPLNAKIGSELSGGLDSSSVFSVIKKYMKDVNLSSFSLRFGEYDCDEGEFIKMLIGKNNAQHYEARIDELNYKEEYNLSKIYQINPHWPIFSTYTMSIALIKEIANKGIEIGITGQGGDQLTVGNWGHFADMFLSLKWVQLFKNIMIYKDRKFTARKLFFNYVFSTKEKYLIKKIFFPWKKTNCIETINQYTS
ncbi:asparagine synthase-related protein, partial [Sulfurovum riftiae]|uniref:asparagine synthase-related protein n=1 Tax=Sulfurovum riftiae TaxID=1630136 RepID=UPI001F4D3FEA